MRLRILQIQHLVKFLSWSFLRLWLIANIVNAFFAQGFILDICLKGPPKSASKLTKNKFSILKLKIETTPLLLWVFANFFVVVNFSVFCKIFIFVWIFAFVASFAPFFGNFFCCCEFLLLFRVFSFGMSFCYCCEFILLLSVFSFIERFRYCCNFFLLLWDFPLLVRFFFHCELLFLLRVFDFVMSFLLCCKLSLLLWLFSVVANFQFCFTMSFLFCFGSLKNVKQSLTLHKKWTAGLVTFTEEIFNGKLHFLCSVKQN